MIVVTPDLMVDLETLGSRPGSAIVSIGAVAFNAEEGYLGAGFYCTVDIRSFERAGLTLDADTVLWWLQQSGEAREALSAPGAVDLATALAGLTSFWLRQGCRRVWSHGANFDEPLLQAAYRAAGMNAPWKYWDARCTRTLFALGGASPKRDEGVHHNALDDAHAQALAAVEAYKALGRTAGEPSPEPQRPPSEEQVKQMVDRFLAWRLPEDFRPDGGISFKAEFNEHTAHPMRHEPSGTNLLDARQAEAMVRHMLAGVAP